MLECKMLALGMEILLTIFSSYLFFEYFDLFFERKKERWFRILGITIFVIWQIGIFKFIDFSLSALYNIIVTICISLLVVIITFKGKFCKKCFFCIAYDAIWMLAEMLIHNFLIIYWKDFASSQILGSFTSKVLLMVVIIALKKIFSSEKVRDLSDRYSFLLVFIPMGSIYIMSVIFMLAYKANGNYTELYSLIAVVALMFLNVLIFYIYIKLADIQYIRKVNLIYEHQLALCERHQEETEVSMLRVREMRHNMKNHIISILGYVEKCEYGKLKKFIYEIMEEGNLNLSTIAKTGHIVIDSLVEYWYRTAENKGIEFKTELCIPRVMPFKEADISLILGNLLENAIEGASKAEKEKYVTLKIKYDRNNLLITVENNYKEKLLKSNEKKLLSTKEDAINHGIGLVSVDRAIRKYRGMMFIEDTVQDYFRVRIVLYGQTIT